MDFDIQKNIPNGRRQGLRRAWGQPARVFLAADSQRATVDEFHNPHGYPPDTCYLAVTKALCIWHTPEPRIGGAPKVVMLPLQVPG